MFILNIYYSELLSAASDHLVTRKQEEKEEMNQQEAYLTVTGEADGAAEVPFLLR